MNKQKLRRLIELAYKHGGDEISRDELKEYLTLTVEFERWPGDGPIAEAMEPTVPLPPPFNHLRQVLPQNVRIAPGCACCRPWCSTLPPPPCPIHGAAAEMKVTC